MADKKPSTSPKASSNYMAPTLFGVAVIFLTFGVAGGWAAIAPLDSAVSASGVIAIDNNRKTVQHLEGGIVDDILIVDGEKVKEGQILFRLDTTQASANEALVQNQLYAARVQEARLLAERESKDTITFPDDILSVRDVPVVAQAIADQTVQFKKRQESISGQVDILKSRIDQSNTQVDGLNRQLDSTKEQIGFINEELVGVRELNKKGLVALTRLLSLERERARLEGVIGQTTADISRAQAVIGESNLQIAQIKQQLLESVSSDITDVRKTIAEMTERLTVSKDIQKRTEIVAPRSGTVLNLKVFTKGQVIRPGDQLLEIVPDDAGLLINAQVSPMDIDSIRADMMAEVRLSAFKSRTTPVIYGRVREISPDRLVDEQTRQPYFLARVVVGENDIPPNLRGRLTAGMPADIILPTGERTVLEYIISPLESAFSKAFIEE